jgi:hypothetical protein
MNIGYCATRVNRSGSQVGFWLSPGLREGKAFNFRPTRLKPELAWSLLLVLGVPESHVFARAPRRPRHAIGVFVHILFHKQIDYQSENR